MKDFELKIISDLLEEIGLDNIDLSEIIGNEVIEFSGTGYYIIIKSSRFPKQRIVLDRPDIRGKLGDIDVGYIAFVENSELVLECYSYDQELLPNHRETVFVRHST